MKKMFRWSMLLTLLLTVSLTGKSQNVEYDKPKVGFQIRGGLNISNLTAYYDGNTDNAKAKIGFNVGAIADINLKNSWYLQTGLLLTSKGAKIDDVSSDFNDATMNAMYLQVPLYVAYKIQLPNNSNTINLAFGPYFGYGIAGKTSLSERGSSLSISDNTFQSDGLWNRPDAGIGFELQFEIERFIFIWGGEAGITKSWKREYLTENVRVTNRVSYLSAGFKF